MTQEALRPFPWPNNSPCTKNEHCQSNFCSKQLQCTSPGTRHHPCTTNPEDNCPPGLRCHRWSSTCQPPEFSVAERCRTAADCPLGGYCLEGTCYYQKIKGMACVGGEECRDGLECSPVMGVCLQKCIEGVPELACPTGQLCKQGSVCSTEDDRGYVPDLSLKFRYWHQILSLVALSLILLSLISFFVLVTKQCLKERRRRKARQNIMKNVDLGFRMRGTRMSHQPQVSISHRNADFALPSSSYSFPAHNHQ